MLFDENDEPHLKAWIIGRLANDSDADADVLADYVLALLRHDDTVDNIRKMFDDEIPDFLSKGGVSFTDDVFYAIKYKSYLPGARQPPVLPPQAHPQIPQLPQRPDGQFQPQASFAQGAPFPPLGPASSRKRAHSDRDDEVNIILDGPSAFNAPQPYKQARRGGKDFAPRGGRYDNNGYGMRGQFGGRDLYQSSSAASAGQFGQPPPPYPPYPHAQQSMPPIDPNSIMENIQRLQQMGIPIPQPSELPQPVYSGTAMLPPRRKKGRCRDYDTKGYCSRGNHCMYEHGPDPAYMPTPPFGPSPSDEYDPNNASLSLGPFGMPSPSQGMALQGMPPFQMGAGPPRQENKRPKRLPKGRPAVAANGPVHDKTKSTIVVQNIPEQNFTDADIRAYFSQFGDIVELNMQDDSRLAIIKFDAWESATAAWSSPKVIFDNRFVKVFWHKDESENAPKGKHTNGTKNGTSAGEKPAEENKEPEFDMEEFLRKQQDAQKIHEEKTQKRQEIEKERQKLEELQKELVARQQEEKRKLQARLAAKDGNGTASPSDGKPSTPAEALRAQLAALEEEANSLGIDPNEAQDDSGSWAPRGRGRGRRVYRGRGGFPPRASRGSYGYQARGGSENRHAAYAAYSLDLRPKIIAITGADFTVPEKDEALRQYLFGTGEFSDIHIDQATTHITFKDRKTGEQFMFGVTAAGKNQIPGLEEKLELSWVNSAPKKAGAPAAGTGTGEDGDGDALMTSGLEDAPKEKTVGLADNGADDGATAAVGVNLEEGEVDQGDMDYEGIH